MKESLEGTGRSHRTIRARLSRIGVRLLLFNVLAVVMPVAGILYLDVYEEELLQEQERSMVQQARLVAAALAPPGPAPPRADHGTESPAGAPAVDGNAARGFLARLTPGDARIRVYDPAGTVVADSARHSPRIEPPGSPSYDRAGTDTRDEWLYRLGSWLATLRQRLATALRPEPPEAPSGSPEGAGVPAEVGTALRGRFGAATRPTPGQRSLTLTVALPILSGGGVRGAVTVSQSTFRLLQTLYAVRLRIFRIVMGTLAVSVAISALLTLTIVRPIRRLRRAALSLARGGRDVPTHFPGTGRRDEVGDLARALEELTRRLQAHVTLLESFAGDVAHEFRNPLTSVRTAIEVLQETTDPAERARFLGLVRRDVERLDRLVVGVRDLARIDSAIERDVLESVDVGYVVKQLRDHRYRSGGVTVTCDDEPLVVRAHPDRLVQVIENLVDNALSFSPEPGTVDVSVRHDEHHVIVAVSDRGPGIPEGHRDRIFERFFSYRPGAASGRHQHAGLGLAIARAIIDAYKGVIAVRPRDGGGSVFEVRLPRV